MSDDLKDRARFVVQLFRECDAIQLPHKPTEEVLLGMIDRIEELEAKLAKAVETLEKSEIMHRLLGHDEMADEICTTIAELKGKTDD